MWAETDIASSFYFLPIWGQLVGIFFMLVVAYGVGAGLQRLLLREPCTDAETALVGSALGLLAFLIGFTFSIALSRYEERRTLVLAEANAIGTTWLRAQLVEEPMRRDMQETLIRYTDIRLQLFSVDEDLTELRRLRQASQVELDRLWNITAKAVIVIEPAPLGTTLLQTVNETIDIAESRRATYVTRIPRPVILGVILFALITAGLSGFARGGRRHFIMSVFTYVMLASIIGLVLDLDRPSAGAIRILPGPLVETRAGMALPAPEPAPAPAATAAVSAPG